MSGPAWVPARLAHLKRDARGLPVPFVNAWGKEDDVSLYAVRPDATVRMEAVFRDDEAATVPDFLKQSPQRQRWCVGHGWCQVCGRTVPWSRRFLVLSSISLQVIEAAGREYLAVTEPWLCEMDARLAMERCPGLIRRQRDDDLTLVQVARRDCSLAISRGWIEGPLEEYTKRTGPAMWLKILLRPEILPADLTLRCRDGRDAALLAEALGGLNSVGPLPRPMTQDRPSQAVSTKEALAELSRSNS